jgi:pyrophosphatase PpaX
MTHSAPDTDRPAFDVVIFDQDGTLVDTMDVIFEAFVNTARRFADRRVTREELFRGMGPPEEEMLRGYVPEHLFPEAVEFFFGHYHRTADRIRLFPGVKEALECLDGAGVKLGLFTGKGRRGTRWTLDLLGLGRWFASPVTGDDVERYKPDPEGVRRAMSAAGVPAERSGRALVVGDSPYDIQAGRAAGTKTGVALWGVGDISRFDGVEADFRFETPADLVRAVLPVSSGTA